MQTTRAIVRRNENDTYRNHVWTRRRPLNSTIVEEVFHDSRTALTQQVLHILGITYSQEKQRCLVEGCSRQTQICTWTH